MITIDDLKAICPKASSSRMATFVDPLNAAMAEFESRGRRHATRLSRKIAAVGIALVVGLWAVIIFATHIESQTAVDRARAQGHNLSAAFASESTRMMDAISSAMELTAGRVREEWARGQGTLDAARLTAEAAKLRGSPSTGQEPETSAPPATGPAPFDPIAALQRRAEDYLAGRSMGMEDGAAVATAIEATPLAAARVVFE